MVHNNRYNATKTAEEELSKLNDELEMRVIKRTAEFEKLNAELKVTEQKIQNNYQILPTTGSIERNRW